MSDRERALEVAQLIEKLQMFCGVRFPSSQDKEKAADLLLAFAGEMEREAIIQCAIEAGERNPEGVSSHTMLGDMWDSRIEKFRQP